MIYNIVGRLNLNIPNYTLELLESDGYFYFRKRTYEEDSIYNEDWFYLQSSFTPLNENFFKEVEDLKKSFIRNKKIEELLANL